MKKQGRQMVEEAFAIVDGQLGGRQGASGDTFGVTDPALFYVERWARQMHVELPANVAAHYERVKARPAVAKVMQIWGES